MNKKKHRIELYSFYDHQGIAAHLEQMAKKGWMIERISNWGFVYHKTAPERLHFSVCYYPDASDFDPEPSAGQATLYDFCACTGWELACTYAQMQIFVNRQEHPVPIETDPVLEIDTIHQAVKKGFLPGQFTLLAIAVLQQAIFCIRAVDNPAATLSDPTALCSSFFWLMLTLTCAAQLHIYFRWHAKAQAAAQHGEFLELPRYLWFQKIILCLTLLALAYWLLSLLTSGDSLLLRLFFIITGCTAALAILTYALREFLKRKKASRTRNKALTLGFYSIFSFVILFSVTLAAIQNIENNPVQETKKGCPDAPLTMEDLGFASDNSKDSRTACYSQESPLLRQVEFHRYQSDGRGISYTQIVVKQPVLYDWCKNSLFRKRDQTHRTDIPQQEKRIYQKADAAPWQAKEAYQLTLQNAGELYWYLLCYEDCILEIQLDWEPTAAQKRMIGETCGGNLSQSSK